MEKAITVLISKETQPYVHRTRPIHIVEPEISAIAKFVWAKKLMSDAEKERKITNDQYGRRKRCQAQSAVLNKVLYYNSNVQNLRDTEYDNDDLRSSYDREMVNLVLAEAQIKHGLLQKNAVFVRKFINSQEFLNKTSLGISNLAYSDQVEKPTYGMGQGIAWSGPGWMFTSNTIIKVNRGNIED